VGKETIQPFISRKNTRKIKETLVGLPHPHTHSARALPPAQPTGARPQTPRAERGRKAVGINTDSSDCAAAEASSGAEDKCNQSNHQKNTKLTALCFLLCIYTYIYSLIYLEMLLKF